MSETDIWVLCAPKTLSFDVQKALSKLSLRPRWAPQPHTPGTIQTRLTATMTEAQVADLASWLSKHGVVFEITHRSQEPCLILCHPGLGLKRLAIDLSGEIVLRVGQLERLVRESAGNSRELERLIRLQTGTAWLDLLEPYRQSSSRVRELPKAV